MEHTFTPEVCKDQPAVPASEGVEEVAARPAVYEGTITLKMPTYDERLDMAEEVGADALNAESAKSDRFKLMRVFAKHARARLVKVDVKRKADGFKFDSWDLVQHETDLVNALVLEIGTKLIGRFSVGGNPS